MSILKNVLAFTGLNVGVPASLPHLLNVNGVAVAPCIVIPQQGDITVSATATNVTVTRKTGGPTAVNVYVEYWHTVESVVPAGGLGSDVPFIIDPGSNEGGLLDTPTSLPQQWKALGLVSNTATTACSPGFVSVGNAPSTLRMLRNGSIVGLSTLLSAAVTGGSITVTVSKNGALGTLHMVQSAGTNSTGGQATQNKGIDTYVAGDLIGVSFSTSAGLIPGSGGISLIGVYLQVIEEL